MLDRMSPFLLQFVQHPARFAIIFPFILSGITAPSILHSWAYLLETGARPSETVR